MNFILLIFFSAVIFLSSVYSQSDEGDDFELFLKTQKPVAKISSVYETFSNYEEEEIDSETAFQTKRCKFETILKYAEILSHFSKVDGLLAIKNCATTKEKNPKSFEDRLKQHIFLLSKFPMLEILTSENNDENLSELTKNISLLWEDRVYIFSNFYHDRSLLWLGEEKEISEEINRIIYTDMNEKRKISLLRKISDDIKVSNQRIYHLFQYSTKNPFQANNLEEENQKSREAIQKFLLKLVMEDMITIENRKKAESLNSCLSMIDTKKSEIRLTSLLGFWQDYAFLENSFGQTSTKDSQAIWKYLKKNIYNSHHFERRLEKGLNVCQSMSQSK